MFHIKNDSHRFLFTNNLYLQNISFMNNNKSNNKSTIVLCFMPKPQIAYSGYILIHVRISYLAFAGNIFFIRDK